MANYRITVTGARPAGDTTVKFDCVVERQNDVNGWDLVEGAPAYLPVPTNALLSIVRSSDSDAVKRIALSDLVRQTARSMPETQGILAIDRIVALLPSGWPVTVEL